MFAETPAHPPFDAELVAPMLEVARNMPELTLDNLPIVRQIAASGLTLSGAAIDLTAGGAVTLEERMATRPGGDVGIPVLIVRPSEPQERGPSPLIYYLHGGGMVAGTRRTGVEDFLDHVVGSNAVIVSPEYRLAPENRCPAQIEDSYAALVWAVENAAELGIDSGRILVAGGSAGGGLAAGVALMARDRGFPHLTHQILMCPMLDDRIDSISTRMLDREGVWDRRDSAFGWNALLGDPGEREGTSVYAIPGRARDLSNLPSAYIDVGSVETFRDPAIAYAQRLSEAGVDVSFHMWSGATHGYELWAPRAHISEMSRNVRNDYIRRALQS